MDTSVICQPSAVTPQGGVGRFQKGQFEVGPRDPGPKTYPFQKPNAPIMRRGIAGEPETTVPTEREEKPTGPK